MAPCAGCVGVCCAAARWVLRASLQVAAGAPTLGSGAVGVCATRFAATRVLSGELALTGATLDAAAATGRAAVRGWSLLTAARRGGEAFRSSARADEFAESAESAGAAEAGALA